MLVYQFPWYCFPVYLGILFLPKTKGVDMYNLMVIDDESSMRENIIALFPWEKLGFRISGSYSNGLKAIGSIVKQPPDAILSDIRMPMMTGLDLLKELHSRNLRIPVVLLSAYADFEAAQQAIDYGAFDYMVKPVSVKEINDTFSKLSAYLGRIAAAPEFVGGNDDIRKCIDDYFSANIAIASLSDFAMIYHMDIEDASSAIEKEFGVPFKVLQQERRMQKAVDLMQIVNMHISEIAYALGYKNVGNFTRAFKQYFGVGPLEYRKTRNFR